MPLPSRQNLTDTDIVAYCLHNLTMLKLDQHQLDVAEKYHLQDANLGLKEDHLTDWQLDEAAIAAAHGNYAKAILGLREAASTAGSRRCTQHLFHYKQIWFIQSRLARDYAHKVTLLKLRNGSSAALPPLTLRAKAMKHQELRTSLRDNIPVYDGYVAFFIAQKQYAKALQVAQEGRARTLLLDEEKPNAKKPVADDAKVWLSKIQHYLARDKSVLLSYFETADECYLVDRHRQAIAAFSVGHKGAGFRQSHRFLPAGNPAALASCGQPSCEKALSTPGPARERSCSQRLSCNRGCRQQKLQHQL